MKKIILTSIAVLALLGSKAQIIVDTVSIGAGYANQKWYSLQNDEQGSAPKNNWDIAFDVAGGYGTSIHINSITGTMLWTYPSADTSAWATVDTTGISTWTPKYNSETSWAMGAFDQGMVTSNPNDVGWGVYNSVTHIITGDSLFVIKLSNGSYKKLWIINVAGGGYNFKYADLDGNNLQTKFLLKSTYSGKNFAYYSLQTNMELNREPVASANWDLLFTQYTAFIPTPYTVSGVLANKGVDVAQADDVTNPSTYNNWSAHTFGTDINIIGYDWKAYTSSWKLTTDTVYFVKSKQGDIWKLIFTGFGGASTGNYIFSKEKVSAVGIKENEHLTLATTALYPNPSNQAQVTLLYNFEKEFNSAVLSVMDLSGRVILTESLNKTIGMHTQLISTSQLSAGVYVVSVNVDGQLIQQKLIVN